MKTRGQCGESLRGMGQKLKAFAAPRKRSEGLKEKADSQTQTDDLRRRSPKPAKPKPISRKVVGSGISDSSMVTFN